MNKLNEKLPPLNKSKLKNSTKMEDEIKRHLKTANQNCNDLKFQIHWNKLDWVNPRNIDKRKNPYCVSSKNFYLKDNNKTAHWVGHAKLKPLQIFFQRKKIINGSQASLTSTTIEQSY